MRKLFFILLPLFLFCDRLNGQGVVLNDGNWLQIEVSAEGVYRLNIAELKSAGLNVDGKDARKLILFSHQGQMLPEINKSLTHGTRAVAMFVDGENDGVLNDADYLLFYAQAPHQWFFSGSSWRHRTNFYANATHFYLGFADTLAPRIKVSPFNPQAPDLTVSRTEVLAFYENDLENPNHMGRTWLGEKMGNETLQRTVSLSLPANADDSATARISLAGAIIGPVGTTGTVNLSLNGSAHSWFFNQINTEFVEFDLQDRGFNVKLSGSRSLTSQFTLNRPNSKSATWLDFIELSGWADIGTYGIPQMVRNRNILNASTAGLRISGSSSIICWNVSDPFAPVALEHVQDGSFRKAYVGTEHQKAVFAVFGADEALKPTIKGKISSQDIMQGDAAELIIITHPDFKSAAEKIAQLRRTNQGYAVKVVQIGDIYKQFSTGQQDIVAVRDYLRCEGVKSKSLGKELKYVLLLGTSSYDPKNRIPGNTNFLPTYHLDIPNKAATYSLDDFYSYTDSGTGDPARTANNMAFSVGRIPCRTSTEADAMAEKLARYDSPESLGDWRSNLSFVTDDVDLSYETLFTAESEKYAKSIDTTQPYLFVNKIFADGFKQVSTGNTERYPEVNAAINRSMENGCLFMNYQGHGGPEGWAQEAILDVPMIKAWKNKWRMPVLFTATCEFSLFDDPKEQSGGEMALLNAEGGPIALMTTTRLVFVSGNMAINNDFWTRYGFPAANEPVPTLGDVFRKLKNRPIKSSEDNKFALLGDPSMPLAFPKHEVVLDSINAKSSTNFTDTLKAFSVVNLKGHINERLKGKFTGFNGNLWIKVLDKPQTRSTLVNDGIGSSIPYEDQTSYIYKGVVSVVNGEFTAVFTIPKDIAYNVDFGKILFYAHNGKTDAAGGVKVKIGSSLSGIVNDEAGPVVKVYMNDTTFRYGGKISADAKLVVTVSDANGLNSTGSGIGRDMIAIFDEGTADEMIYVLNDYFSYNLNSYTTGTISFPVKGLKGGRHTVKVRVWDIFNNSGTGSTEFVVEGNEVIVSEHKAFPNPFIDGFKIGFSHNQAGQDLKAELTVYNAQGNAVIEKTIEITEALSYDNSIQWSEQESGVSLAPGMYFYKVVLSNNAGKTSFSGKLIKN